MIRESTANLQPVVIPAYPFKNESIPEYSDKFYENRDVNALFNLEQCLWHFDNLDIDIIRLLMDSMNYEGISEKLFISLSGIHYRVKKIFGYAGVENRKSFVSLMHQHLWKENPFV